MLSPVFGWGCPNHAPMSAFGVQRFQGDLNPLNEEFDIGCSGALGQPIGGEIQQTPNYSMRPWEGSWTCPSGFHMSGFALSHQCGHDNPNERIMRLQCSRSRLVLDQCLWSPWTYPLELPNSGLTSCPSNYVATGYRYMMMKRGDYTIAHRAHSLHCCRALAQCSVASVNPFESLPEHYLQSTPVVASA